MHRFAAGLGLCLLALLGAKLTAEDTDKWLAPADARRLVGQEVKVEVTIRTGKNRLEKRGEIYLDLELDFRDAKNLAIVITRDGATDFATQGIADPAEHFVNKKIRVTGKVSVAQDVPRIEVNSAKQITIREASQ